MAKYSISYQRPSEPPAIHELEAASEPAARIRFLNLSWVAFSAITINSIAIAADQPEEAKAAARKASKPGKPLPPNYAEAPETVAPRKSDLSPSTQAAIRARSAGLFSPAGIKRIADRAEAPAKVVITGGGRRMGKTYARALTDIPAEIARLGDLINELADEAQALTREGKHDKADAKRASAKKLAAERLKLTKEIKK